MRGMTSYMEEIRGKKIRYAYIKNSRERRWEIEGEKIIEEGRQHSKLKKDLRF